MDPSLLHEINLADAQAYAAANHMRLPTIHELYALYQQEGAGDHNFYWSSTAIAGEPSAAWAVSFYDGHVLADRVNARYTVRCVRL